MYTYVYNEYLKRGNRTPHSRFYRSWKFLRDSFCLRWYVQVWYHTHPFTTPSSLLSTNKIFTHRYIKKILPHIRQNRLTYEIIHWQTGAFSEAKSNIPLKTHRHSHHLHLSILNVSSNDKRVYFQKEENESFRKRKISYHYKFLSFIYIFIPFLFISILWIGNPNHLSLKKIAYRQADFTINFQQKFLIKFNQRFITSFIRL